MKLVFATRPSKLARWQTSHVIARLAQAWADLACEEIIFTTRGDKIIDKPLPEIGGKGLFTAELEEALRREQVDAAVHSLKDLPTEDAPGLTVGVIPARADVRDAWVCPAGHTLKTIPEGALVGTSSHRRQAQLRRVRPDLDIQPIRGNVDTRLRKVQEGQYDAIVLAAAGLTRLGLEEHITEYLDYETMLPAPGQGALAVQCRAGDEAALERLHALEDKPTRMAVTAERAFLEALGGGCSLPVGAFARVLDGVITLLAVVVSLDGKQAIELRGSSLDPVTLGRGLARRAITQGARELLG